MKIKVSKPFVDKHTKEKYEAGQEVELTEERYAEIKRTASFNIQFEEIKEKDLDKMTKEELIIYAKEEKDIELNMEMTKKEMVKKLNE